MRGWIFDVIGLGFVLGSAYFFYKCVEFLGRADYVSAVITLVAAFIIVRIGVEITRQGIAIGREDG
ncbi:MAG: hypothetical protein ACNA8W_22770 [Bradymonadaceae bacterium]